MNDNGPVTSTNWGAGTFTLDKLREAQRLIDAIPPAPIFASSAAFPAGQFLTFEWDGTTYVIGRPEEWKKIPTAMTEASRDNPLGALMGFDRIAIRNADSPHEWKLKNLITTMLALRHYPGKPAAWPKDVLVSRQPIPRREA